MRRVKIPLKYMLTTSTTRMEYAGSHIEGLDILFRALPDEAARVQALEDLRTAHKECLDREAVRGMPSPVAGPQEALE